MPAKAFSKGRGNIIKKEYMWTYKPESWTMGTYSFHKQIVSALLVSSAVYLYSSFCCTAAAQVYAPPNPSQPPLPQQYQYPAQYQYSPQYHYPQQQSPYNPPVNPYYSADLDTLKKRQSIVTMAETQLWVNKDANRNYVMYAYSHGKDEPWCADFVSTILQW